MNVDLPDDLAALLHGAIDPDAADGAADARVKHRVLQAIAAESTPRHFTVPGGDNGWQPFGEGLRIKALHETGGVMSYLVRLAPGASLPPHRHPIDEECVVLGGEVVIGELRVAAGGFHLGRQGVPHDRLHSEAGAVIYLRGAVPDRALVI
jgi:anti-sigma factor ChrR (cupin superfamily)